MIIHLQIHSQVRGFRPFVSVRVAEIQSNCDPAQWRHLPREMNVAKDVSCGIPVEQLERHWKNGPQFLYNPEESWPEQPSAE